MSMLCCCTYCVFLDHPTTFEAPRVILSFSFSRKLSTLFIVIVLIAHVVSHFVKLVSYLPHLLTKNICDIASLEHIFSFGKKWYSVCRHVCICVKQFPNPRNVVLIKHLFFVKNIASLQNCFAEYKHDVKFQQPLFGVTSAISA